MNKKYILFQVVEFKIVVQNISILIFLNFNLEQTINTKLQLIIVPKLMSVLMME